MDFFLLRVGYINCWQTGEDFRLPTFKQLDQLTFRTVDNNVIFPFLTSWLNMFYMAAMDVTSLAPGYNVKAIYLLRLSYASCWNRLQHIS